MEQGRKEGEMKAEEIKILDSLEESINGFINSYDPCSFCENKTETGHKITCHDCAYFYAGQFKARRDAK